MEMGQHSNDGNFYGYSMIFMHIMNHIQKYIPIFAKIALVGH